MPRRGISQQKTPGRCHRPLGGSVGEKNFQVTMFKRNLVPVLYCGFFLLLIGIALFALPEFSSLVIDRVTPLVRLTRALMALWLIFAYVLTGIPFIPNIESSPIPLFKTWRKYYRFRDENQQPRFDRSIFPMVYFLTTLVSCVFASLVLVIAVSTFAKLSISLIMFIAFVNFVLLFLPFVVSSICCSLPSSFKRLI